MSELPTTPDLGDILHPFLLDFGLKRQFEYEKKSGRAIKHNIGMKSWKGDLGEVFVYDDNTIGLRSNGVMEVELDLAAHDPDFFSKLEAWFASRKSIKEKRNDSL
jgi:hypothetical protein